MLPANQMPLKEEKVAGGGGGRGGEEHPIKQVVWSESPYPVNLRPGSLGPGLQVWASRHFA